MSKPAPKKDALAEEETFESAQDACDDLKMAVQKALDALDQATSCETEDDLIANLREAQTQLDETLQEITDLLS